MPDISIAYLPQRLSGGAGNTTPGASLGGDMSSERVLAQSSTALVDITGVTIEYAGGNPLGLGTLTYVAGSLNTLTWAPFGDTAGTAVDVGEGGKFAIFGATSGVLLVDVEISGLPITDESDTVTIDNIANEVWDDVAKADSFAGDVEYRCKYLTNTHPTAPFLAVKAYIAAQPSPGTIAIGVDPAGVGDGVTRSVTSITRVGTTATVLMAAAHGYTTGQSVRIAGATPSAYNGVQVITVVDADEFTFQISGSPATPPTGTITAARGVPLTVANENTAPDDVTFSEPDTLITAITLGALQPGESVAYWERRTVLPLNTISNTETDYRITFQAFY